MGKRSADNVAAEAIDTLRMLREENMRLREENVEIREVSMARQSLANEAMNLARSLSPLRKRPTQSTPKSGSDPRLLGQIASVPGSVASVGTADPFQPIGAVGPEVRRCCAALAQKNSQTNAGVLTKT